MYCSLAYEGLFAKFWSIFAIYAETNEPRNTLWGSTYQGQGSSRMFGWHSIYKHVRLRSHDSWVNETEEEKAADKRTYCIVSGLWVLSLYGQT
jgi:hypothetical protein